MLWSLNLVLKATVRGARDSRVTLLIGLCWHQARPTSTKAAVAHFSPPGPAGPGVHKHFHPLRAGPPGRMITLMGSRLSKWRDPARPDAVGTVSHEVVSLSQARAARRRSSGRRTRTRLRPRRARWPSARSAARSPDRTRG